MVVFNRYYSGNTFLNLVEAFRPTTLFSSWLRDASPLIAAAALLPILAFERRMGRIGLMFILFVVSTFVAVAAPGLFQSPWVNPDKNVIDILAAPLGLPQCVNGPFADLPGHGGDRSSCPVP